MASSSQSAAIETPVSVEAPRDSVGARVVRAESQALQTLAAALDGPMHGVFTASVEKLFETSGRIIVTGMGKSGHIGNKIAATLASTGSPAYFIHPGEASHGDLGMLMPGDSVLALSNSGDTAELNDLVAYTRRFGIPLIAMTGPKGGALAQDADLALLVPAAPEACPMGLAPTTSTTMMLALGDAIAVALIERRGFSAQDFQVLHPGGKLGRKLLRVSDLMHGGDRLPLVSQDTKLSQAILEMTAKSFGCVGVLDAEGQLVGIVTDGDLRRHMDQRLLEQRADAVMTPSPRTIRVNAMAAEALGLMNARAITSLFVVDTGRPVGILHIHDCLRAGVV